MYSKCITYEKLVAELRAFSAASWGWGSWQWGGRSSQRGGNIYVDCIY